MRTSLASFCLPSGLLTGSYTESGTQKLSFTDQKMPSPGVRLGSLPPTAIIWRTPSSNAPADIW